MWDMRQIAYLCEDMPPGVAQEATQAALQALVKVCFDTVRQSRLGCKIFKARL